MAMPAAMADALERSKDGPLDYATAAVLIHHAARYLQPRPNHIYDHIVGSDVCVFWEEPTHRRRKPVPAIRGGRR